MISFECDYEEGTHPKILEELMKLNFDKSHVMGRIITANMLKIL